MKFYSEVTKMLYDTEKELKEAEQKISNREKDEKVLSDCVVVLLDAYRILFEKMEAYEEKYSDIPLNAIMKYMSGLEKLKVENSNFFSEGDTVKTKDKQFTDKKVNKEQRYTSSYFEDLMKDYL